MWLLGLEAAVAMFLLIFIVWWTMFSGKKPHHPPSHKSLENKEGKALESSESGKSDQ